MSDENIESLCGGCGETLSHFLQEMADQNAKVATCPKCGKIHEVGSSKDSEELAEPVKKPV